MIKRFGLTILFLFSFFFLAVLPALAETVDTAWVRRYNGLGIDSDEAYAIAVDGSGNVYVTGWSYGSGTLRDYATIKYYQNGDTAWVRRYNGPGNYNDEGSAIAVDGSGNVYVTGYSEGSGMSSDYATIKYDRNGNQLWVQRYNGPGNEEDRARAIAVDGFGNLYVTGYSAQTATYPYNFDYATIKYYPNGDTAWVRRYNGPENYYDEASAIAVDGSGNIYVTGCSGGSGTYGDYLTIKYYPNGDTAWVRRYNGPANNDDKTYAIAVDGTGNVYVTGGSGYDYATIKYDSNGNQLWVRRYNGSGSVWNEAYAIAVDGSGNVYVTGGSLGIWVDDDYATIKYDSNGNQLWVQRYNGPGNNYDEARAIAVDGSGNVYVTGYSDGSGEISDYATIKYDSNGNQLWLQRYYGPVNPDDKAHAIVVDSSGNVYVTGGSGYDYATIKYDSNGNQLWVQRYNGTGGAGDCAYAIAIDGSGNVYVTGGSNGIGTSYDYATVKYDSNGNQLWVQRYNGPGNSDDYAWAIEVDSSGNVYVAGDQNGIFVVSNSDYATIKYDSNGNQLWIRTFNGPENDHDHANALAVDALGNVYVTGSSLCYTLNDYVTIKYDSNGNQLWVKRYDGPEGAADGAYALALDGSGNVYVTGCSAGGATFFDYATVKYDSNGNQLWVQRYSGSGYKVDEASAIAVDGSGNVYVTGYSDGGGTHCDYVTIKYVQTPGEVKDETGNRELPSEFILSQNYPNPFNLSTKIEFTLPHSGFVWLDIYDILGKKLRTLVSENLSSGYKAVLWDGKDDLGKEVCSGIYFYQLKVGEFYETKKLVLLK